ncbi:MAG: hypothetical protein ACREOU_07315 [Candidatus Eiseniibacteriota bacterium]
MRRFACAVFGALACLAAGEARGAVSGAPARATLLAPAWTLDAGTHLAALAAQEAPTSIAPQATAAAPVDRGPSPALAGLKSLILPGWGQLSTGHKTQAAIFFTLDVATWASYITFQRQSTLRRESSFETARLYAGIDLETKEEDFRRLVGLYQSNEVFNQYVIMREAAYFIDDPAEQQRYIEENSIGPEDAWFWDTRESFDRYREQRQSADQAEHNGRFALGTAIVTRLVSGVMAARQAADNRKRLAEQAAVPGQPVGRFVFDVRPGPGLATESRLAWVVTF